ncbi:MAG: 4Fe-4S dicluster domain-containing protein [Cyclobacteriaceae bacterium]
MQSDLSNQYRIDVDELRSLFEKLSLEGYDQIGPIFRDGAIMLEKLNAFDDIALGYLEEQDKGKCHLTHHKDQGYFQYSVGPQSFKKFLHPPRRKLWSADGSSVDYKVSLPESPPKMAFWGVRGCDIAAIKTLDKLFLEGSFVNDWYQSARKDLVIIAVGCTQPSQNCFCTSLGTGPMPNDGFDMSLIEIMNEHEHYFIAQSRSSMIDDWLSGANPRLASEEELDKSVKAMQSAIDQMPIRFDPREVSEKLKSKLEHPEWESVAERCLSCANCTMVCPTCFCSTTEDITDITGDHTERWLTWDSCFVGDFSYIHGGQIRKSTKSRYRQWMTHKLSNWYDQLGTSGCVGCGRCIAWCPVGIDITEEVSAICDPTPKSIVDIKSKEHEELKGNT